MSCSMSLVLSDSSRSASRSSSMPVSSFANSCWVLSMAVN